MTNDNPRAVSCKFGAALAVIYPSDQFSGAGGLKQNATQAPRTKVSTADMALKLGLSPGIVCNNTSEAIARLGAENRFYTGRIARLKGWL